MKDKKENTNRRFLTARGFLTAAAAAVLPILVIAAAVPAAAKESEVIEDGVFRFTADKETGALTLIGCEFEEGQEELAVPGQVVSDGRSLAVTDIKISWQYYDEAQEQEWYRAVRDIVIPASVTGEVTGLTEAFTELEYVEFKGSRPPEAVRTEPGPVFIVPDGKEEGYRQVIESEFYYSRYSDLTEKNIRVEPDIAVSREEKTERGFFDEDGLYLQVTKKAGDGTGHVSLIGLKEEKETFYELPGIVEHDGYRYEITELTVFSLVGSGAKIIVLPDTVTKMGSAVFDQELEVLFLSKNCPVIPAKMIMSEPDWCSLKYVHIPDGVETISDRAFDFTNQSVGTVRIPKDVSVGAEALGCFDEVIYGEKDEDGAKLEPAETEVKVGMLDETKLAASLSGNSKEDVVWASSDTELFEITDGGIVNPKKAGTAYAFAYTENSGLYGAVKVQIKGKLIGKGIFTYRITNAAERTVTVSKINPNVSTKVVRIPETITFQGKRYTVTAAVFNEDNPDLPLINGTHAQDNRIETIVFPKTITGTVGYLGVMNEIKTIEFKGSVAPKKVTGWMIDGGLLASQAVIRVPKKSIAEYKSAIWYGEYDEDQYGEKLEYRIEAMK